MKLPHYGLPVDQADPVELARLIAADEAVVRDGRVFPEDIQPIVVRASHPDSRIGKLFKRLDAEVSRFMFWNSFRGVWAPDGDLMEARREMPKAANKAADMVKRYLKLGDGTLDKLRSYLLRAHGEVERQCYFFALPWMEKGAGPIAGTVSGAADRARVLIAHSEQAGVSKSQLRLAVFKNNPANLDGLIAELLEGGDVVAAMSKAGAKGGRPSTRYFMVGSEPEIAGESPDMLDPFHFKPEEVHDDPFAD
jgi:hypothetical protein